MDPIHARGLADPSVSVVYDQPKKGSIDQCSYFDPETGRLHGGRILANGLWEKAMQVEVSAPRVITGRNENSIDFA